MTTDTAALSRPDASAAVAATGWRYLLASLRTAVAVSSLEAGLAVARAAVAAAGADGDGHLRLDVRPDRVELVVSTLTSGQVTQRDVAIVHAINDALVPLGVGGLPPTGVPRPVQALEIAIDTLDRSAIRPFWKAVLAYVDEPDGDGSSDNGIVDPAGQGPAFWFQSLDAPRPQRNRIHFDVTVAHDEAPARIRAALDAGGVLVSDARARAFWILADVEGNEICVCTWQDRD